jgi:vitamin B12 transporter
MRTLLIQTSVFALAAAACAHPAYAQADTVDEKVVVVATKQSRKASETGSQVTVISREDIERKGAVFAIDVLRDAPGVSVTQTGGPGGQASVRLRGEEGYRTLLLVDGMKLSDPAGTQSLFNFANLMARDIERIEILRGPQALLYGADAIGGVIAITTRRGGPKAEHSLAIEAGSFKTVTGALSTRGQAGAFDYALSASAFDNEGISAKSGPAFTEPDGYANLTLHGVAGISLAEAVRLEAVARYVDAEADFDGFFGENNVLYTEQFSGRLALTGTTDDRRLSGTLAANYMTQNRADYENGAPFLFGSRFDSERRRLEALGRFAAAADHDLVVAADYEDEQATTDFLKRGRAIWGALAEYQGRLSAETFVTLGARFDDHEEFGQHVSWRATAAHELHREGDLRLTAKASAGTGFRAPSLFELYDAFSGDPTLKEEAGFGWDLGLDVEFAKGVSASIAYFNQSIEDEIRFDPNFFVYIQNPSTTKSWGVETTLSAVLVEGLRAEAAYTYNEATVGSLDAENGLPRARRPRHIGSLSLDYAFDEGRGGVTASLQTAAKHEDGFFTFRTPLDGRAVVNLSGRYRVLDGVTITLRGQNIFDERYREAAGFNSARAGVFAGLDWRL